MKIPTPVRFAAACLLALLATPSARALTTIMDQIGTTGSFFTGDNANTSENFTDFATFDIAVVDNFTVTGSGTIITVAQAALLGFGGFTSFSLLTGYDVNVYSSVAAANASLTGNLFHSTIPSAMATVTTPFSGDADSGLISLPVSIPLAAGNYYISIVADGTFATSGEVGPYVSTGLAGSNPDGNDAFQENPGGGFGFTDPMALNLDAAYRLLAIPEPSTWAFLSGGLGMLGALRCRRRRCLA